MNRQIAEHTDITELDILECLELLDHAELSHKPRAVMCALMSTPGFITRTELMDHVYGEEDGPFEATLCQYVRRIRLALEGSRFDIRGRYSFGYEFVMYVDQSRRLAA